MNRRIFCLAPFILAGCSQGSAIGLTRPKITVASVTPERIGLNAVSLLVELNAENNNPIPLPIDALDLGFEVEGTRIGFGQLTRPVRLPANASTSVPMRITGNPVLLGSRLGSAVGRGAMAYTLNGSARVGGFPVVVPIRRSGQLRVGDLLSASSLLRAL